MILLTNRHGLPDETWHEPNPEDPLSLIDQVKEFTLYEKNTKLGHFCNERKHAMHRTQVELALAYNCADLLTKKNLVDYVHRNRQLNSMRIDTLGTL